MNLPEKKRAERYVQERFEAQKRRRPVAPSPTPPKAVKDKLARVVALLDDIKEAGWVVVSNHNHIKELTISPGEAMRKSEQATEDARVRALEEKRDALVMRVWDGELTFSELEELLR